MFIFTSCTVLKYICNFEMSVPGGDPKRKFLENLGIKDEKEVTKKTKSVDWRMEPVGLQYLYMAEKRILTDCKIIVGTQVSIIV
jgi:hypothetical protein